MDIRRVQKVSTGTFTISLPKKWAERHKVGAHTLLSMTESPSGSLVIKPQADRTEERVPRLSDHRTLEESVIACYILGAPLVVLTGMTPDVRARALNVLQQLPGYEITNETAATLTITCLLDEKTVKLFTLFDRLCALLKYGAELAVAGNLAAVQQNELEVNRNYFLCERILTKASHDAAFLEQAGIPESRMIPSLQVLVKRLEHVGDALKELPAKVPAQQQKTLLLLVGVIVQAIQTLTAGKLAHADLARRADLVKLRDHETQPQLLFLFRTIEDLREELILLKLEMTAY